MQPESRFKNKVLARLRAIPNLYVVKIQQVSIRGIPDIIGCYRGYFFAWELKVGKNKIKPGSLQWLNLELINKAEGIAREVRPENLEECIKELTCFDGCLRSPLQ